MSLSDRETAEGFAGGGVNGIATLDQLISKDLLPSESFAGGVVQAVASLQRTDPVVVLPTEDFAGGTLRRVATLSWSFQRRPSYPPARAFHFHSGGHTVIHRAPVDPAMGIVNALRGTISDSTTTLYECRNCGTTLAEAAEQCDACGADEVVCFQF
jgi:hypothetical protein